MKMYIFVCAFDDSGLDVEVQGVYKSEEKAIEGMMDYFVDTCNYIADFSDGIAVLGFETIELLLWQLFCFFQIPSVMK